MDDPRAVDLPQDALDRRVRTDDGRRAKGLRHSLGFLLRVVEITLGIADHEDRALLVMLALP